MSDPIRWLDENGEASPHERMLLSAGRDLDPPPGAQDKVWAALQLHIGPGGGGGGNGGGSGGGSGSGTSGNMLTNAPAASGSSGASISAAVGGAKAAIAAVAGALAVAGAIAAFVATSPATSPSPSPHAEHATTSAAEPWAAPPETTANAESTAEAAPVEPLPSPIASAALPPDAPPARSTTRVSSAKPSVREAPSEPGNDTTKERASRLREENRMLGDARAALRNGDSASALEKLEAMGGQFPDGVLAQEREVLAIEALVRAGNRTAASARAAAFLAAHPTSPHAKKLRGFLQ